MTCALAHPNGQTRPSGASYNEGTQVQGIGVRKAEQIYFETLTERLTPRAILRDVRYHLSQTCQSLVGEHGITSAD